MSVKHFYCFGICMILIVLLDNDSILLWISSLLYSLFSWCTLVKFFLCGSGSVAVWSCTAHISFFTRINLTWLQHAPNKHANTHSPHTNSKTFLAHRHRSWCAEKWPPCQALPLMLDLMSLSVMRSYRPCVWLVWIHNFKVLITSHTSVAQSSAKEMCPLHLSA